MRESCKISEYIYIIERISLDELFEKCIPEPNSGCWICDSPGKYKYYKLSFGKKIKIGAHRAAWILKNQKPIPDGLHALHKCDIPRCNNPDHIFLGTKSDNMKDAFRKGRTKETIRKSLMAMRRWHEEKNNISRNKSSSR